MEVIATGLGLGFDGPLLELEEARVLGSNAAIIAFRRRSAAVSTTFGFTLYISSLPSFHSINQKGGLTVQEIQTMVSDRKKLVLHHHPMFSGTN